MSKTDTKSEPKANEKVQTEPMTLAPDDKVTLRAVSISNAGKDVKSRWGKILFGADGVGEVTLPAKDLELMHSLGWMTQEDQEHYLGLVEAEEPSTDPMLQKNFDAQKEVNVRLALRNVELEGVIAQRDAAFAEQAKELSKLRELCTRQESELIAMKKPRTGKGAKDDDSKGAKA